MKLSLLAAELLGSAVFAADEKMERKASVNTSGEEDSAGSQCLICLAAVAPLDHQSTTFGKLIKGDDVLEKIGNTSVVPNSMGEMSKPTKRVTIEKIDIVPANSVK